MHIKSSIINTNPTPRNISIEEQQRLILPLFPPTQVVNMPSKKKMQDTMKLGQYGGDLINLVEPINSPWGESVSLVFSTARTINAAKNIEQDGFVPFAINATGSVVYFIRLVDNYFPSLTNSIPGFKYVVPTAKVIGILNDVLVADRSD